jgi:hypothetical protein
MSDAAVRAILALSLARVVGVALSRSSRVPRDPALGLFAVAAAVLGIFAILGPLAALLGAITVVGAFGIGAVIYGAVALAARLAR